MPKELEIIMDKHKQIAKNLANEIKNACDSTGVTEMYPHLMEILYEKQIRIMMKECKPIITSMIDKEMQESKL